MTKSDPAVEPISRTTLSGQITERLRDGILAGLYRQGEQLNEAELARRFGVSRGPLREAMQRLIQDGLLENRPHRGVFVPELTGEDLADIFVAREAIETAALRRVMAAGESVSVKNRFNLTLLLISHDLRVVRYASDRVAVMYLGRIVEVGERDAVFDDPLHPYTRALIAASLLEENGLAAGDDIRGEPPSPLNPPRGCHFHPRCAIARPRCANGEPGLAGEQGDHRAACFFPGTQAPR